MVQRKEPGGTHRRFNEAWHNEHTIDENANVRAGSRGRSSICRVRDAPNVACAGGVDSLVGLADSLRGCDAPVLSAIGLGWRERDARNHAAPSEQGGDCAA